MRKMGGRGEEEGRERGGRGEEEGRKRERTMYSPSLQIKNRSNQCNNNLQTNATTAVVVLL